MTHFDCRPDSRSERSEQASQNCRALLLGVTFFRIQRPVYKMDTLLPVFKLVGNFEGCFPRVAISSDLHQGCIDGNPRQPGCKLRPTVEVLQMNQTIQKTLLKGVFRVFAVSGNPKSDVENSFFMAFAEFSEGSGIPSPGSGQQALVRLLPTIRN